MRRNQMEKKSKGIVCGETQDKRPTGLRRAKYQKNCSNEKDSQYFSISKLVTSQGDFSDNIEIPIY